MRRSSIGTYSTRVQRIYLAGPPYAEEYRRRAKALVQRRASSPSIRCGATSAAGRRGTRREIVEGDLADIDACDAVLAAFTAPDEGTAMEAWHAHAPGSRSSPTRAARRAHPWTVYIAAEVCDGLDRRSRRSDARSPKKPSNSLLRGFTSAASNRSTSAGSL